MLRVRLRLAGISYRHHPTDEQLAQAIREVGHTDTHGRMVQAGLSVRVGIRATRAQILRVQRVMIPEAFATRRPSALRMAIDDPAEAIQPDANFAYVATDAGAHYYDDGQGWN